MNGIACAHHPDRVALAYCAGCGKPLCGSCVVRLSTGNYCQICAETPNHRPPALRRARSRMWIWVGLGVLAAAGLLISRLL